MADPTTLEQQLAGRLAIVPLPVDSSTYRTIFRLSTSFRAANVAGSGDYPLSATTGFSQSTASAAHFFFHFDPADYAITGRTTYLRIVSALLANDNAPAATFIVGLYPIGTPSGGANTLNPNLGTVVSGSTATFTTPAANSKSAALSSGDFAAPAAGHYAPGVNISAAMGANSTVWIVSRLEVRNV